MDNDPKISVVSRDHVFTQMEDKIRIGDVFAFSLKEKSLKSIIPNEDGTIMVNEQYIMQPNLTSAILVKIFDNTRVQLIDEDGVLAIIDRGYFKDFIKVYEKDSTEALLFYGIISEKICMNSKVISEFALKQNILCSLSQKFYKLLVQEEKSEKKSKMQKTNVKKIVKNKSQANIF